MINCQLILSRISPYVDGELDGREMLRVRQHVEACPRCACELEDCRRLKSMISALPDKRPAQGFEQRLLRALASSCEQTARPGQPQILSIRSAFAFGAAAVAAFAVFQFGFLPGSEDQTAAAPAVDVLVLDQELDMARGMFPTNRIPAGLETVPGSR